MNFKEFNLHPSVAEGIRKAGYTAPTPIQEKAIPEVMKGSDLMGLAQTGTGKTAAFVLPILHRLMGKPRGRVSALIIAPTRELADQIHETIGVLGSRTRIRSAVVYGGVGITPQIRALKSADIVVACPGRLLDHIDRGTVNLSRLEVLVLDEADQMLDMGFFPSIRKILTHLPEKNRQSLLFSATMPEEIRQLTKQIMKNPATVRIGNTAPAETVSHALYPVAPHLKTDLLLRLLAFTSVGSVLVFTRTKHRAKRLGEKLSKSGYSAASLQGNLSQARRQAALNGFRSREIQILVATDIAARGIDVSKVSHVINYDIPSTPEAYIHRIGRTGRAECTGEAFTLVTDEDSRMVSAIQRAVGSTIERRTLEDFNYAELPAKPGKPGGDAKKRPQRAGNKRPQRADTKRSQREDNKRPQGADNKRSQRNDSKRNPKSKRRKGEGAFALFSPRKSAGTPAAGN